MGIKVDGIFVAPAASLPMEERDSAELIAGKGISGDRYASQTGTYSVLRVSAQRPGEREPGRQITLLSADSVDAALARAGLTPPASLGDLRRNVVLRGVSAAQLLSAIGTEIAIGEARVFVHRNCVPCMYNERKNGCAGLMEALWEDAGVACEVVRAGVISKGDAVSLAPTGPVLSTVLDGGAQAPGYYVRPSKRTAEQVRAARERLGAAKQALSKVDPEGVQRIEASYQSAGLSFWGRGVAPIPEQQWVHDRLAVAVAVGVAAVVVGLFVSRK